MSAVLIALPISPRIDPVVPIRIMPTSEARSLPARTREAKTPALEDGLAVLAHLFAENVRLYLALSEAMCRFWGIDPTLLQRRR